jgi:hypothetical protein
MSASNTAPTWGLRFAPIFRISRIQYQELNIITFQTSIQVTPVTAVPRYRATLQSFDHSASPAFEARRVLTREAAKQVEDVMTRTFAALATAAVLALGTTVATTTPAEAHCGFGCGLAIGVGSAAVIGAASAGPAYGYGPAYYPACYWRTERVFNGWGYDYRRVRVCG